MKRIFTGWMSVVLAFALLSGCGQQPETTPDAQQTGAQAAYEEGVTVRVAALKGPTAMGLVNLMKENEGNDEHYAFHLYTAADEIVPLIAKGEIDIALIPTNLAATLYQKTDSGVQVLDVNAGNVLYVVSHDETMSGMEGLKGKTVYMTGKGTTPEWTLRYLLNKAGLAEDDLTIEFKSEATEVLAAVGQDMSAVGILPQPFATVAMMQDQELALNFSLDDAWKQYSADGSGIVTGVTIVRKAFAEDHPAAAAQFIQDHQQSVDAAAEDSQTAAQLIEEYGIVKAAVASQVLENFNPLSAVSGSEMKAWVSGYLDMLFEMSPDAVGGKLPDEGFYYLG